MDPVDSETAVVATMPEPTDAFRFINGTNAFKRKRTKRQVPQVQSTFVEPTKKQKLAINQTIRAHLSRAKNSSQ